MIKVVEIEVPKFSPIIAVLSESESRGRGKDEDRLRRTPDRKCGDREVSVLKGWQYT